MDEGVGDLKDPTEGSLVIQADPHDVEGDGVVVDMKELDVLLLQDEEDGVEELVNLAEEEDVRPPAQTTVELLHAVAVEGVEAVTKGDNDEFMEHARKHDCGSGAKDDVVNQHDSPGLDGISVLHEGLETPDDQQVDEGSDEWGVDSGEEGLVRVPSPRVREVLPVVELVYQVVDVLHVGGWVCVWRE